VRGRATLLVALLAGVTACGGSDGDRADEPGPGPQGDERVIRGWNDAVNAGDFDRAGDYFERGATVEQQGEIKLNTPDDAEAFSRSLPCRSDVTDVDSEDGSSIAAFRLREGRDGDCAAGGTARVRFVIRDGKIREWRQLPEAPAPEGEQARSRGVATPEPA